MGPGADLITPFFHLSKGEGPRLRVGVLVDGPVVPHYCAVVLEDIARCNFADVVLAIEHPSGVRRSRGITGLANALYMRLDRLVAGEGDPLELVDAGMGLDGVERLRAASVGDEGDLVLPSEDLAKVRERELDVILRFCTATPKGEILHAARRGVWSYHFGADEHPAGPAPFFQDIAEGSATRQVLLEVLGDAPLVLARSTFGREDGMFVARLRSLPIWETTHFVLWKLHELHEQGWDRVRQLAQGRAAGTRAGDTACAPTAKAILRVVAPRVAAAAMRRIKRQRWRAGRWTIGLRRASTLVFDAPAGAPLEGFRWLEAPRGHYWADPFLATRGDATFLFFEDFDEAASRGVIARAEVLPDGSLGPVATCLDPGHHVSFPYVFEHGGEMFMLPESLAGGMIALYRARRFPDEWVREKVLFHGNATDTTMCERDGRFYFFTTLSDRHVDGMKAMLFVADSLTGALRLHPASPVTTGVRDARNAGAIFARNGRVFRPVQDCAPRYGYGFSLQEIVTLTEDRFEERPWRAVAPSQLASGAKGVHTYNECGGLEVIDKLDIPRARAE